MAAALLLSQERWQAAVAAGLGLGVGRSATTLTRFWSRKGLDWDEELRSRLPWITIGASTSILMVLAMLLA